MFRFKKKHNTKKFFKFTGIAFIVSFISFAGFGMSMTPEDKQKAKEAQQEKEKEKQKEEAKKRAEEKRNAKEKQQAEEKKLDEQKKQEEKQKQEEEKRLDEQKKQEEKQKQEEEKKLEEQKKQEEKQKREEENKIAEQKKQAAFSAYTQNIKGGTFIKDIKLTNNEAEITYFDSYTSYKSQKPDSPVKEDSYKQYFATGDAIEKMFVSEPARLLRQFPDVNAVKMTLPYDGKTYSINLDRKSLNKYIGFKIESLQPEDQSWQKKFNDSYVYDKTKREKFFKNFVTVQ